MIQYLKDLPIGATVTYLHHEYEQYAFDVEYEGSGVRPIAYPEGEKNIIWMVAAQDHFAPNTTTLWAYKPLELMGYQMTAERVWIGSGLQQKCEALYESFPKVFKDRIVPVNLETGEGPGPSEYVSVFSFSELSTLNPIYEGTFGSPRYRIDGAPHGAYLGDELKKTCPTLYSMYYWTRSPLSKITFHNSSAWAIGLDGTPISEDSNAKIGFRPFINVRNDSIVTYEKMYGHHIMYEHSPEPFGFVKVEGAWKPLYGTKPLERE